MIQKNHVIDTSHPSNISEIRSLALHQCINAVIGMDMNAQIIDWNLQAQNLFGWSQTEALGKDAIGLLAPKESRASIIERLQQFKASAGFSNSSNGVRSQVALLRKNGTEIRVEINLSFITASGATFFYAFIDDISDGNFQEEQYRQVLDSISDLVILKGPNSKIIWANRAFREYYGMTVLQLTQLVDASCNESDFAQQYIRDDAAVFETNQAMNIPIEPITRHDGVVRYFNTAKTPIRGIDGKCKMLVAVCRDITDKLSAEDHLQRQQLLLQTILDYTPSLVQVKDLEGRYLLVNNSFSEIVGVDGPQIIGKTIFEVYPTEFANKLRSNDLKVLQLGKAMQWEEVVPVRTKIHTFFTVRFPLFDRDGKMFAICGVSTDITEAKHAQAVIETQRNQIINASKMSALGQMASGVAHEINNPLAVIHARAGQLIDQLRENRTDTESLIKGLEKLEETALRISKIVKGLRLFARDDSQDPFVKTCLKTIIEDTLGLCSERFRNHNIRLDISPLPEEAPLACHSAQISQVLLNLLNNAFDAVESLPESWVRVDVLAIGNTQWEIRVSDSGPGIPQEIEEKIMLPFFTTKEVGKGTGLGLSISRGIIEAHGGQLFLDRKHACTCFVVRLPQKN